MANKTTTKRANGRQTKGKQRATNKNNNNDNNDKNEKNNIQDKRNRIIETYNNICTNLPQVQKLTDKRKTSIDKFLKEFTEEQFKQICKITNTTYFLIGKNKNGWKADFDFLMRIDKATSILEGKYESETEKWLKDQRDYTEKDFDSLYAN